MWIDISMENSCVKIHSIRICAFDVTLKWLPYQSNLSFENDGKPKKKEMKTLPRQNGFALNRWMKSTSIYRSESVRTERIEDRIKIILQQHYFQMREEKNIILNKYIWSNVKPIWALSFTHIQFPIFSHSIWLYCANLPFCMMHIKSDWSKLCLQTVLFFFFSSNSCTLQMIRLFVLLLYAACSCHNYNLML